jgi:hypothetical protein
MIAWASCIGSGPKVANTASSELIQFLPGCRCLGRGKDSREMAQQIFDRSIAAARVSSSSASSSSRVLV